MKKQEYKKKDIILTAITLSLLIFLIGFIKWTNAQVITIGVQPAFVQLNERSRIKFGFYNSDGDTDAIYTLIPDECLSEIIINDDGCWDGEQIEVPKGTTRDNPVYKIVCFDKPVRKDICYLYVEGKPKGYEGSGTVNLRTRVGVKFSLNPATTTTTTITKKKSVFSKLRDSLLSRTKTTTTTTITPSNPTTTTTVTTNETTTITQEQVEVVENNLSGLIFKFVFVIGVFGLFAFLYWNYKDEIVPILIVLMLLPSVRADDVTVTVTVIHKVVDFITFSINTLIPLMLSVGFIFTVFRLFTDIEIKNYKTLIYIFIIIMIATALLFVGYSV